MARPETVPAPTPTGIDYLALLAERHATELAKLCEPITYTTLAAANNPSPETNDGSGQCPGQPRSDVTSPPTCSIAAAATTKP